MSGRPRQFDVDEALGKALGAFWSHGYEATSMADLMAATGLQKGSIYNTFGDKHQLFLQVLDKYLAEGLETMRHKVEDAPSPHAGIRAWLDCVVDACSGEGPGNGCFALNSAVELGPHDPEVQGRVERHFAKFQAILAAAIRKGQGAGEFRGNEIPQTLAEFLVTIVAGLLTSSKGAMPKAQCDRIVGVALRALEH